MIAGEGLGPSVVLYALDFSASPNAHFKWVLEFPDLKDLYGPVFSLSTTSTSGGLGERFGKSHNHLGEAGVNALFRFIPRFLIP